MAKTTQKPKSRKAKKNDILKQIEDFYKDTLSTVGKSIPHLKQLSALAVVIAGLMATLRNDFIPSFLGDDNLVQGFKAAAGLVIAISIASMISLAYTDIEKFKDTTKQIKDKFFLIVILSAGLIVVVYSSGKTDAESWTGSLLTDATLYGLLIALGGVFIHQTGLFVASMTKKMEKEYGRFIGNHKVGIAVTFSAALSLLGTIIFKDFILLGGNYVGDSLFNALEFLSDAFEKIGKLFTEEESRTDYYIDAFLFLGIWFGLTVAIFVIIYRAYEDKSKNKTRKRRQTKKTPKKSATGRKGGKSKTQTRKS